jgi:DNA-binding transcriptional LysR family regulator
MLPVLTGALCTRFPQVSVEALSMTEHDIQRKLLELEIDVGLTLLTTALVPNLQVMPLLYTENYTFLSPTDGPLSDQPSVSWADVAGVPLCLLKKTIRTREIIDRQFAAAGCSPTPQIETDSILSLCAHVGSGHWSTVLPRSYLHPFGPPRGTVAIPLRNATETEKVGIVVFDREPLPPVLRAFLAIAEEAQILAELRRLNDAVDLGDSGTD